MPGKLPASESLLNAIFAHTNLLGHDDRQVIIRFLAGEDLRNQPAISRSGQLPVERSLASDDQDRPDILSSITSQEDEDNSNYFTHFRNGSSSAENSLGLARRNLSEQAAATYSSQPSTSSHRSILLHEERRTETRPRRSRASSSTAANGTSSYDLNGDENEDPEMKTYTIIDQIIFEMDYMSGCWRKLRRRMRMSERRNSDSLNSRRFQSSLASNNATDRTNTRLRSRAVSGSDINANGQEPERTTTSPRRESAILSRFRSHIASMNSTSHSTTGRTRGFGRRRRSSLLRTPAIVYSPPETQIDDTIELADTGVLQALDDSHSLSDSVSSGQDSSHAFDSDTDADSDAAADDYDHDHDDHEQMEINNARFRSEVIFERTQPVSANHWLTITGRRISQLGVESYEALNPATGSQGTIRGYQSTLGQGR